MSFLKKDHIDFLSFYIVVKYNWQKNKIAKLKELSFIRVNLKKSKLKILQTLKIQIFKKPLPAKKSFVKIVLKILQNIFTYIMNP